MNETWLWDTGREGRKDGRERGGKEGGARDRWEGAEKVRDRVG